MTKDRKKNNVLTDIFVVNDGRVTIEKEGVFERFRDQIAYGVSQSKYCAGGHFSGDSFNTSDGRIHVKPIKTGGATRVVTTIEGPLPHTKIWRFTVTGWENVPPGTYHHKVDGFIGGSGCIESYIRYK